MSGFGLSWVYHAAHQLLFAFHGREEPVIAKLALIGNQERLKSVVVFSTAQIEGKAEAGIEFGEMDFLACFLVALVVVLADPVLLVWNRVVGGVWVEVDEVRVLHPD